jgi:RNA polymerase sigma-70 factor (ECF subfamily)
MEGSSSIVFNILKLIINTLHKSVPSYATENADFPSMSLPTSNAMTDEQLLEAILRQDATAQRRLYEKYARKMFGVCLRYARSREEAEDLLQDGFLKVFQKLSSFKNEGSLEGWIRRVIVNTSLDYIRQQKLQWADPETIEEPGTDAGVIEKMNAGELLALIQQLPTGFRTVFNLYAIEGYSHREIGEMLQISEGTSKSQYARARVQLMERINVLQQEKIVVNDHK